MTAFGHMAVGGALGSLTGNPAAALAFGVGSHIPADMVPHFDFDDYRIELALMAVPLALLLPLAGERMLPVLAGMAGGVLPDFENLLWKLGVIRKDQRVFPTHNRLLPHGSARPPRAIVWQILILVAAAALVRARG